MRSVDLGLKTALIVTPVNVLHNWRHEFIKWRPSELKPLRVFMLEDVIRSDWFAIRERPLYFSFAHDCSSLSFYCLNLSSCCNFVVPVFSRERRSELLAKWRFKGGVFLIGYTAFRNLSLGKHVKDRHMARDICHALQVKIILSQSVIIAYSISLY